MPDNKINVRSYSGQYVDKDDIEVVIPVLMSPFLTTAPQVDALEAALCGLTGKKHAVACVNRTAGSAPCLYGLGVGPGDIGLTSPNSFIWNSLD